MSKELARKLKDARALLGETQEAFAARLGVPKRTLIAWENDQYTPREFTLEALNAKLDAILKGKK
jgi:DNA-binding XRE family transcriptional regulator